jgi:uncharacterized Zn finger protein
MVGRPQVHCPSCGSADTLRERLRGVDDYDEHERADTAPVEADRWCCLRCDFSFTPYPCPACGSYEIDGAKGVSGAPFKQTAVVVRCRHCGEMFPAHSSVVRDEKTE